MKDFDHEACEPETDKAFLELLDAAAYKLCKKEAREQDEEQMQCEEEQEEEGTFMLDNAVKVEFGPEFTSFTSTIPHCMMHDSMYADDFSPAFCREHDHKLIALLAATGAVARVY